MDALLGHDIGERPCVALDLGTPNRRQGHNLAAECVADGEADALRAEIDAQEPAHGADEVVAPGDGAAVGGAGDGATTVTLMRAAWSGRWSTNSGQMAMSATPKDARAARASASDLPRRAAT